MTTDTQTSCFHCGEPLGSKPFFAQEHSFCCNGCKEVYLLLSDHELGKYYTNDTARKSERPRTEKSDSFLFLDDVNIRSKYVIFEEKDIVRVNMHLPQIHCASCIYLLEHLAKLNPGILQSTVNFPKRSASITINQSIIKLSELAILLTKIGYEPHFEQEAEKKRNPQLRLMYQLGFAGFAFGSIMLWTFPEYLGIDETFDSFRNLSSYLSLIVSLPVLFYSAQDYFKSALGAMRSRNLNLDIPIAIGILALYIRSLVAIAQSEGSGFMDSFAGFVLFLLIGKWFQSKTYQWLSFERDFSAYFPIAVLVEKDKLLQLTGIEHIQLNDYLHIRNEEIIPCDGILLSEKGVFDYSFVTGEADWNTKSASDLVYAGGKVCGETVRIQVTKTTSRSELTQLWNEQHRNQIEQNYQTRQDKLARFFIFAVLIISAVAAIFWYFIDSTRILEIITSVLIVACPCALALAAPFTYGNMLRVLGKNGFYLRSTGIVENLQHCDTIVFDKTGTITKQDKKIAHYHGKELSTEQWNALLDLTEYAVHPYAQAIYETFKNNRNSGYFTDIPAEIPGMGIGSGKIKLGNSRFVGLPESQKAGSYLAWENEVLGFFTIESELREGLFDVIQALDKSFELIVLSGDSDRDSELLSSIFPSNTQFHFNQSPLAKKEKIERYQQNGKKVLMIGDGLNDAGALKAAHVGLALSEDLVRFTPASDAILKANNLNFLGNYLKYIHFGKRILNYSFIFSITYNSIGIYMAFSGQLTPLVSAILMPLSSISVVLLATLMTQTKKLNQTL